MCGIVGYCFNEHVGAEVRKGDSVKKIYVGNLPYDKSESDVRELFEEFGSVESVALISDRDTGRPKGGVDSRIGPHVDPCLHDDISNGPGADSE